MSLSKNVDPGIPFSISMSFTDEDLKRFHTTGTNIVVAKPADGGAPNVAWNVYRPLEENAISWVESYGIYMSNTDITDGAVLTQMSTTHGAAVPDQLYSMSPSGSITGPQSSGGAPDSYTIINQYSNLPKGYLTTGLTQDATVNGTLITGNAVSAALVLFQSTAQMTPFTTVYLWTQSQVKSNTVVTNVTSTMTKVVLGGGVNSVALAYDASTGTFLPAAKEKNISLDRGLSRLLPRL